MEPPKTVIFGVGSASSLLGRMKFCFPSLGALLIDIPRQSSVLVVVLSGLSHGSLCIALHAELVEVKPPSLKRVDIEPRIEKIVLRHDAVPCMQP